jgi:hypothetical protein
VCVKGGYKTVTPIQIANCLSVHSGDAISYRAVRVYFACLSLVAIREAASRTQKCRSKKPRPEVCFRLRELCAATGLSKRSVARQVRCLKRADLLSWNEKQICVNQEAVKGSEGLLRELSGKRSPKRPIPVPRAVLRFVAGSAKSSVGKTILAYVLRGVSIDSKSGEIRAVGTVKASWIADVFGLSLRSVKSARKVLIEARFITKDVGSFQRKLNRDGAYFRVNLVWEEAELSGRPRATRPLLRTADSRPKIAPPMPKNCTTFSPPYKEKRTSNEIKNQETKSAALKLPGVCKANTPEEPTLRDVKPEDLKRMSRLKVLFSQAVRAGWLKESEANFLNWVGAALRATTAEVRDPVRVFVSIAKQGRWDLITQEQEDRARLAIMRYREGEGTLEATSVILTKLKL